MRIRIEDGSVRVKSKRGEEVYYETNGVMEIELPDVTDKGKPREWKITEKKGKVKVI